MRQSYRVSLIVLAVAAGLPTVPAAARTRGVHAGLHHARVARGVYPAALSGRSPAYAPPAPIGVGLFGTGLFYGYGLPDLSALGF